MTWRLPDTHHSAGTRRGTATLKFYEGRDNLLGVEVTAMSAVVSAIVAEQHAFDEVFAGTGMRVVKSRSGPRGRTHSPSGSRARLARVPGTRADSRRAAAPQDPGGVHAALQRRYAVYCGGLSHGAVHSVADPCPPPPLCGPVSCSPGGGGPVLRGAVVKALQNSVTASLGGRA